MFGKSIVAAVMRRYGHDGTCTITGQYIVADPYGNSFIGERINGITSREYTAYATVGDTFAFCTFLGTFQISVYFCLLCRSGQLRY